MRRDGPRFFVGQLQSAAQLRFDACRLRVCRKPPQKLRRVSFSKPACKLLHQRVRSRAPRPNFRAAQLRQPRRGGLLREFLGNLPDLREALGRRGRGAFRRRGSAVGIVDCKALCRGQRIAGQDFRQKVRMLRV